MSDHETSIDIDKPIRTVYDQWTQFETFPSFMAGVDQVTQTSDTRLHWVATIAGQRREWDAEITEQRPDEVISWRSIDGTPNSGTVRFQSLEPERTRVHLDLQFEPSDTIEKVGDALGFVERRAEKDLERFKEFVERTGATGAWRGTV